MLDSKVESFECISDTLYLSIEGIDYTLSILAHLRNVVLFYFSECPLFSEICMYIFMYLMLIDFKAIGLEQRKRRMPKQINDALVRTVPLPI